MPSQIANVTPIRSSGWSIRCYASFITGGTPIATGTVTNTPSYPVGAAGNVFDTTYVTGAFTDVLPGMEVVFTDTATGAFKGRTHVTYTNAGAITAGSLPVREYAQANLNLVAGDTFRVYKEWRIHDKLVAALAGFPPDHLFYTDEGSNPPPVACSGGHYAGRVDVGQTYATVLTTGGSYTVDPDSAGTVTHLWTLPTGVTFAPGSASTDATPTLRAVQGEYTVYHAVTDSSNSKTTVQHIHLKVHDAANPPHQILFTPDTSTADSGFGGTAQIVSGLTTQAAIPDGCLCIVWSEARNDALGSTTSYRNTANGRAHILSIGIVRRDTQSGAQDGSRKVSFEIISPLARLKELTSYSKVMEANATPDAWNEVKTLGIKRAKIQLIQFYSTLIEAGFDLTFDAALIDYLYPALYLQRSNFVDQVKELADGVDARMVCDRTGRFNVHTDPRYIPLASRAAITKTWNFLPRDVLTFEFPREHVDTVEKMKASGFTGGASGNLPLFSLYPGEAPGEGVDAPTRERLIVTDQDDLNARTGRYGAAINRVYQDADGLLYRAFPLSLTLRGIYDFFDYSKEYVNFTTSLARLARDVDLTKFLFCLESTSVSYDFERGTATTTCVFDVVTNAAPGETYVPPAPDAELPPTWSLPWTPPALTVPRGTLGLVRGMSTVIGINEDGNAYPTTNFERSSASGGPTFVQVSLGVAGAVMDSVQSPFTPTRQIVVNDDDTDAISTVDGMTAAATSYTTTARKSLRAPIADKNLQWRVVDASFGGQVIDVISYYGNSGADSGVWRCRSTDDGATWGTETNITAHYNSASGGAQIPGLFCSSRNPGTSYTSAYTASGLDAAAQAELYSVTGGGASATGISSQDIIAGCIHKSWADNENTLYYGNGDLSLTAANRSRTFRKIGAGVAVDISPVLGGNKQRPPLNRGLHTCPIDANTVLAAMFGNTTSGVLMSRNQGTNWTQISTGSTTDYSGVEVAGNDRNFGYGWGSAGAIGYVDLLAGSIDDRSGNLLIDFPSIGRFVRIRGG